MFNFEIKNMDEPFSKEATPFLPLQLPDDYLSDDKLNDGLVDLQTAPLMNRPMTDNDVKQYYQLVSGFFGV